MKIVPEKQISAGAHDPDKIDETLAFFAKSERLNSDTESSNLIRRPKRTKHNPYAMAQFVTEKMRRFLEICMVDEGLTAHPPIEGITSAMEVVYAIELLWLNVINADNIPATADEIAAARKAAYDYYAKHVG
jgi:hypothetical protein